MRQIQIQKPGGLENLKLENVDSPNLANDEVLMKIHASSLNYHDLMVALGLIPTDDKRVPLSDGAGEILEVGSDVTGWKIGDKVMSVCFPNWVDGPPKYELLSFIGDNEDGYAAEVIAIKETALTKIPDNLSFSEAATLPCAGLTAWRALVDEGNLKKDETVLVQGTGGVSIFALQLAKCIGAIVIARSSSEEKLAKLSSQRDTETLGRETSEKIILPPEWMPFFNFMPLQQNQFCQLTDRFFEGMDKATKSGNEIKVNMVHKERQENFDGLLPGGEINNWIFTFF